jgi:Predicted transcriptional regulators
VGDTSIFQLLPPLSDAEYRELKADIEKRGVLVPVEYDENENIIDGHHRVKACCELGITKWPRLVRRGLSEDEKKSIALVLNLARRHLTHKQKTPIWKHMRDLGMTLEAIAKADGAVSKETIRSVFKNLKTEGPETVKGKDGKIYPAKKKRKPKTVYISEETAEKVEKLPEKYKRYVLTGAEKYMEAARNAKVDHIKATANLPDAKYRVIYADPPWKYDNTQPDYHSEQRDHYMVMSLEDITGMEVANLCEDNAVLFYGQPARSLKRPLV